MKKTYNWGIVGLGKIAHKFTQDLMLAEGANLYGVASRSLESAKNFGKKYGSDKCYGSYKELTEDPNIDVVYIATPHVYHCENTLMCLDAGKAVLCEKAFGMNKEEVDRMVKMARDKNLFLMEALWTRFIPSTEKVLELLAGGIIGSLKSVRADFGFNAEYDTEKRLFNKALGGGSLLDVGIYPIFLSLLTLGVPHEIEAKATMTSTKVDGSCAMIFSYPQGELAILDSSLTTSTPVDAWLHGDKGSLKMHSQFHHSKKLSHIIDNKYITTHDIEYVGNGYYHEIVEVIKCLREGKLESDKMPLSFSLDLMTILDQVRTEIGLNYN